MMKKTDENDIQQSNMPSTHNPNGDIGGISKKKKHTTQENADTRHLSNKKKKKPQTLRRQTQVIQNTILRAEIINKRDPRRRLRIPRHILQQLMHLAEILALIRRRALHEPFPRFGIGQTSPSEAVESLVFGFDRGDHGPVEDVTDDLFDLGLC